MVIIHPTATHSIHRLAELQQATGMQIARGNTFLRLVDRTGTVQPIRGRQMPSPATVSSYFQGPTGGDAA